MALPTMTKSKHWIWVGCSYLAAFILAWVSFMTVPILGLIIVPIPAILTVIGIVLYLKNTQ